MRTRPTTTSWLGRAATWLLLATFPPVLAACGGGSGNEGAGEDSDPPPAPVLSTITTYSSPDAAYRVAEAIVNNVPTVAGGTPEAFSVDPALPPGLTLDTATGVISGTPTAPTGPATYTITVSNEAGQSTGTVDIIVGPELPAAVESLPAGFAARALVSGLPNAPRVAKMALAPDGRLFFVLVATATDTGEVRVYDPATGNHTLFASLTIFSGGHQGVLGLALDPGFGSNGFVYVLASTPGDGNTTVDRMVVYRYTEASGVGTNRQIVIDDLPTSPQGGINVGGEIVFDNSGALLVSIGDIDDPSTSQADTSVSLAGKVLRYDVSSLPATPASGNPTPGDPEWCRGLRNTFAMTVHPTTGGIFGADNGPASDDELNYLQGGRNFEWMDAMVGNAGRIIRNYPDVIVPTGLAWHDGSGWGEAYADSLFLVTYDQQHIIRFEMSGNNKTDIDRETTWGVFREVEVLHKPLDIEVDRSDGSLYVSTFTGIYKIEKFN